MKNFIPRICVVGLGYVGLPLTVEFAKRKTKVAGFDISIEKIIKLKKGIDPSNQIDKKSLTNENLTFSSDARIIQKANFIIVSVPTPIDKKKKPDLTCIVKASETIGENLSAGSIVVYESTVYPGVTEEVCLPILEKHSKLKCGKDFFIGYSPERVNPGDKKHTINKITKVVSGIDKKTTQIISKVYSIIIKKIFLAKSIKIAEAAKVIENIQRDLNIALINELALIFNKLNIDTRSVLEAASTKWNFHGYSPGLVGGHCIGVDPYYLVYKAQKMNFNPQILLAGRKVNESMAKFVTDSLVQMMIKAKIKLTNARVLIMGLTFKENINDIRNSKAENIINHLKKIKIEPQGFEPYVNRKIIEKHFKIKAYSKWDEIKDIDAIILFNSHNSFSLIDEKSLLKKYKGEKNPVIFDIKGFFNKKKLEQNGFLYTTL